MQIWPSWARQVRRGVRRSGRKKGSTRGVARGHAAGTHFATREVTAENILRGFWGEGGQQTPGLAYEKLFEAGKERA